MTEIEPFHSAVHLQIDYARELNEQQLAAVMRHLPSKGPRSSLWP
jgi:hypothetical protein